MKKEEIKTLILKLEPDNSIAKDARSSHAQLLAELNRARQRIADSTSDAQTLPASVRYRVEEEGFSWRVEGEDFLSDLSFGPKLPDIGTKVMGDDDVTFIIAEHESGLIIRAGDLEVRESFDPRRIYCTKNGNDVVFKRRDPNTGKPILWSFRQSMEIITGPHTELTRTEKTAKPTAGVGHQMTQKNLAAYLISRNPMIKGSELTVALRQAFPAARISERHGPHYLSLSRCGRLPEAPEDDPRTWK